MTQPFRLQLGLRPFEQERSRRAPGLSAQPAGDGTLAHRFLSQVRTAGLTNPYALAAVMATGQHESGWSPRNVYGEWSDPSESGKAGRSGGALSWRNERLANLRRFAASRGDDPQRPSPETQALFFISEDPRLTAALQNAGSVEEAQRLMNNAWRFAGYDRPGGEAARRLATARGAVGQFGDDEAPQQASATQQVFERLEAETPGRYQVIDEDEYDQWRRRWDEENATTWAGTARAHLGAVAEGLGGALGATGEGIGHIIDYLGAPETGQWLAEHGQDLARWSSETFGPDEKYRGVTTDLAGALGSMIQYYGPGGVAAAVTRGMSAAARVLSGLGASAMMAGPAGMAEAYQRATNAGIPHEEAVEIALQGIPAGVVQVLPMAHYLKRLPPNVKNRALQQIRHIAEAAVQELGVETAGAVLQNFIEQSYNEERGLWDDALYQGMIGAGAGGMLAGLTLLATRGRGPNLGRATGQPEREQEAPAAQQAPAESQLEPPVAPEAQAPEAPSDRPFAPPPPDAPVPPPPPAGPLTRAVERTQKTLTEAALQPGTPVQAAADDGVPFVGQVQSYEGGWVSIIDQTGRVEAFPVEAVEVIESAPLAEAAVEPAEAASAPEVQSPVPVAEAPPAPAAAPGMDVSAPLPDASTQRAVVNDPGHELHGATVALDPDQSGIDTEIAVRVVLPDGQRHVLGRSLLAPADQASAEATGDAGTRGAPVVVESVADVAIAEQRVAAEPSEAQKEAGNYAKGHMRLHGLDITIENARDSIRRGMDRDGQPWQVTMPATYGYIRRTEGADGDHVDVYVGEAVDSDRVFVVDQVDADTGRFDEHKAVLGTRSLDEARRIYEAGFSDGRGADRMGAVTELSVDEFRNWLKDGDQSKPVGRLRQADAAPEPPAAPADAGVTEPAPGPQPVAPRAPARRRRRKGPPPKKPVTQILRDLGGIDPDSPLAGELRHMGIGYREAPGLFRRGGRTAVDNLPVNEHPLFEHHAGEDGYIDPAAILEALRDEYFGQPWRTEAQREAEDATRAASTEQHVREEIIEAAREYGLERDSEVIERALLLYADGLSVEHAVEAAAIQLGEETTHDADRQPTFEAELDATFGEPDADAVGQARQELPEARAQGAAGGGEAAPVQAGQPDAGARQDAGEPRAEPGADGRPQLIIPGTEPISGAEQSQRRADQPLRPAVAQQPMDEGLFGDSAGQADLVDMARQPPAEAPASEVAEPAEDVEVRNRREMRSQDWRRVFNKAAQDNSNFRPNPASSSGSQMVDGWIDGREGRAPREPQGPRDWQPDHATAFNPIDPYLIGYIGGRDGEAREIRQSEAWQVYDELTGQQQEAEIGDGGEVVTARLDREGPWDFADTYPSPDPDLLAAVTREGRTPFENDPPSVEEVVNTIEESLNELEVAFRDIAEGERTIARIERGDAKPPRRNMTMEQWRRAIEQEITNAQRTTDEIHGTYADLFGTKAADAMIDNAAQRARQQMVSSPGPRVPPKPEAAETPEQAIREGRLPVEDDRARQRRENVAKMEAAKAYGADNKLVTQERAEELRRRLKDKLKDVRSGIDPEIIAIGTELTVFHIEAGARRFMDVAAALARDLDMDLARLRPYLRSWYNGARDMMEDAGIDVAGMDDAQAVRDALGDIDVLVQQQSTGAETAATPSDRVEAADEAGGQTDVPELDQPGAGALEGAPTDPVQGAEADGQAGERADERGPADARGDERARGAGVSEPRGLGDREGEAPVPAAGDRRGGGRAESDARPADGSRRAPERRTRSAGRGRDPVDSAATPAAQRAGNYVITDADAIGRGGAKTKFRQNVEAIRLLRRLDDEGRPATPDEQAVLVKFVGWGGLQAAFGRDDGTVAKGWESEAAELRELLSAEEYAAAQSSTRNAHYTSPQVVSAIWQAVERLGFKGGRVLEPSVGVGNFFGLMPAAHRGNTQLAGVELDPITGGIAKHLYPDAAIKAPMGFQDYVVPDNHFDLAIGNPPFGSERLYDAKRKSISEFSIHNYFFAKSIEAVRPGGVVSMVVSNFLMDAGRQKARAWLADRADLIGAIRLPNDAFAATAGTEVTTDIIFLRKRAEGEAPAGESWLKVEDFTDAQGREVALNEYFMRHPEQMLGEFGAYGEMYRDGTAALIKREGQDTAALLAEAIGRLPRDIMAEPGAPVRIETVAVPSAAATAPVGSMFVGEDGAIMRRLEDSMGEVQAETVALEGRARERVAGMIGVRDAFANLRKAQLDEAVTDAELDTLRKALNKAYDAFVAAQGPINLDANKRLFRDDPTWPQISALEENFDRGLSATMARKTGEKARAPSADKAPIFSRRTQSPYRPPTSASSAEDALAATLGEVGRVDIGMMRRLYNRTEAAIVEELGDLIYRNPEGGYETRDHYLSGNVKQKLAIAEAAAQRDPQYERNVEALREVIPADIEAVDINVKPGAHWVPAEHVVDFANHITQGKRAKAHYVAATAKWTVFTNDVSAAAVTRWATDRIDVGAIITAAFNDKTIVVRDYLSDGSSVINQAATDAANAKVAAVKEEWGRWIWQDDGRREALHRLYNDSFNTDRDRVYDGAHLTLPGKVGDDIIRLRPHQKSAVWRIVQSPTTLLDHVVGAGKTFTAIAGAMEMRRMGLARKPMIVVPNHLVGQWAADFIRLYPGANILAATKRDFEKDNRKRLFARVATGDWDAVIVAHSSFGRIPVDPRFEAAFIEQQIADIEASMKALKEETGETKSRTVKQMTKQRDTLREKMKALLDAGAKDDGLTFEEMGVDALFVDEAHEFKNLSFQTSMQRVMGLGNKKGSQKATDLYVKTQSVLERTGGRNVVFLTGTPVSNTMAEMYTMQRYLDGAALRGQGLAHFDAWGRMFGEVVTDWELSPAGKYKLSSRFAKFVNMPELMQRYRSFADVVTNEDIKRQLAAQGRTLPLPKVKGGKPQNLVVERSPQQATYIGVENDKGQYPEGSLVWRSENMPKRPEPGADNMLKIMLDARKAALDMRLIDPSMPDHPGSKVNAAADRMIELYTRWNKQKGTQLVFIDLSTPKGAAAREAAELRELIRKAEEGDDAAQEKLDAMSPDEFVALDAAEFSVYDDLRQKLIDRGIPADEIAFIHDANTELRKEELFGKVRSGRVRFLFGSTPKMGAGMNVQERLVGLHHLDAPWRPSDLEQREGRIIRQGNKLYEADPDGFEVEILRYATKNTLDARMWQTIEGKARFIEQLKAGGVGTREVEDVAGQAANAAEMKAAASGNPLILEEMDLRQQIRKLDMARTNHDREQFAVRDRLRFLRSQVKHNEQILPKAEADAAQSMKAKEAETFAATIRGKLVEKHKAVGEAIIAEAKNLVGGEPTAVELGDYHGFRLSLDYAGPRERNVVATVDGQLKDLVQVEHPFVIEIIGERTYQVEIDNIGATDPTGLARRIDSTVARLPQVLAEGRDWIGQAKVSIADLETQITEWKDAEKFAAVKARHQEVLAELQPKNPPAQPEAGSKDADQTPPPGGVSDSGAGAADSAPRIKIDAERQARLEEALSAVVTKVAGKETRVSFEPTIPLGEAESDQYAADMARFDEAGGHRGDTAGGFVRVTTSGSAFIRLATQDPAFDPMDSAFHEAYHVVEGLLMTDREHEIVTGDKAMADLTAVAGEEIGNTTAAAAMPGYEVRAVAFQRYARLRDAGEPINKTRLPRPVALFFEKLRRALAAVRRALTGEGYSTWEDIFEAAYQGEMAGRDRQFRDFVAAGDTAPRRQRSSPKDIERTVDLIVGRTEQRSPESAVVLEVPRVDPLSREILRGNVQGLFESATDKLRRSKSPMLRDLAERVDRYYDAREARNGWVLGRLRPIINQISRLHPSGERRLTKQASEAFRQYWEHHDNGRREDAEAVLASAPPAVAELVAEVKRLYSEMGDANQEVGVKVFDARLGGWRPIGKVREGEFWPRVMRPEVQAVLQNPNNDPALWNELVDALVDEGHIEERGEALRYLNTYFTDEAKNDYFAGIEKARRTKLPELFYDYSFEAFTRYSRKWASRLSQIEQFGQKAGRDTADAFEKAIGGTLDKPTQAYLNDLANLVYERQPAGPFNAFVNGLNVLATATQLGNPATATLNFLGGTTLNVQMFGIRRVARAYLELIRDWGKVQQTGVEYGILGKDLLNILRDAEQQTGGYFDVTGKTSDALSAFARFTMTWGGYRGTENLIRANAMVAGWLQLQDALKAWNANPRSRTSLKHRAFMTRNRIDADALLRENGQGPETARYLRLMVNIPQGSYRPDQVPIFTDTWWGRFLFKYQKFGTQVSRMFWQNHLRPFVAAVQGGETVRVGDEDRRIKSFLPLFRYFAAAFLGGSAILVARQALFNYRDPGIDWDDLREALEDDDRALTWAMIFDRAYHSLMAASAAGFFGNYIQFGLDVADQQRVKNPLDPPGLASINAVQELVLRTLEQGGHLSGRDMDQIAERALALYRGYKRAGLTAAAVAGSEWHEAKLLEARREVDYARKAAGRYADDAGISQRRTISGRIGRTPMSPVNTRIAEALMVGDGETARAIVRETLRGQPAEERRKLMASMQAAARARQPILIAGGGSDAERAAFLRWARHNLSKANFQRVREVHDRYRRAAARAGLMSP